MTVLNVNTRKKLALQMDNPKAAPILLYLASKMDMDNKVMISLDELIINLSEFKIPKSVVLKSIKYLEENCYLKIELKGNENVYTVNKDIYFLSEDSEKK